MSSASTTIWLPPPACAAVCLRGALLAALRWSVKCVLLIRVGMVCVGISSGTAAWGTELTDELANVPHKVVYETYQGDNWELCLVNADGSHPVNLTNTPGVDELYPHASTDGSKICFVADEGQGKAKSRNVYYMNADGSGRRLVAKNARQPCWKHDGSAIAYLKGEFQQYAMASIATKELVIFDLASGQHRPHPNKDLHHLFGVSWSPDGKWFISTVHGGMGFSHAILAIEAEGTRVVNLGIPGCRPEISPDGKRIAWTPSDWALRVAELDFSGLEPKVVGGRDVVTSEKPIKVYHIDWPPDGNFVAFTRGPMKKRLGGAPEGVGVKAVGWNICIADLRQTNRCMQITSDGKCNKEPDWVRAK